MTDLVYNQGEHDQAEQRFKHVLRGSITPFPLMSKGENDVEDLEDLEIAIKSKGGDCWHYDSGLALWHRCCT